MQDAIRKGRMSPPPLSVGSKNGRAKVSEADVDAIRLGYASGTKSSVLAALYGVDRHTIVSIAKGKLWSSRPMPWSESGVAL